MNKEQSSSTKDINTHKNADEYGKTDECPIDEKKEPLETADEISEDFSETDESQDDAVDEKTELLKKIETLEAEVETYKDRYYRALADTENFRKRSIREKEELRKYASIGLIEALLPIFDNFQLGLSAAQQHPEAQSITQGFTFVADQLKSTLSQNGIKEINPIGEIFDPNHHECVSHQSHETIEEGQIISVTRSGYLIHDRLVRPASVVVSSGVPPQKESEQNDDVSEEDSHA